MVSPKIKVILPELPPELWLRIHELATHVPSLLDPDLALDFSSSSRRARWKLLRESLITKRYLVRVCKQWRSLATPFLYKSLYIGRGRALPSLSSTLNLSKENPRRHGTNYALGFWTQRIDVVMRDHIGIHGQDRDVSAELYLLSEIFRCLPNLTIINFGITATLYCEIHLPAVVLQSIADTSGSCLRAIVWHVDTPAPYKVDWRTFLLRTPNVKTVQCPTSFFVDSPAQLDNSIQIPELLSLEHLSVIADDEVDPPSPEHLPFLPLHRLCIVSVTNAGILPQVALLEKYGGNLKVFQLGGQVLGELLFNLRLIANTCPNLYRLDISFSEDINEKIDWSALPENIQILGLQFDRGRFPKKVYETLFSSLCDITPGTKLKVIQFTDQMNVRDLYERHRRVLSGNAGRLAEKGLELHDHKGSSMQ
ncbi:hypothetical protein BDZ94DRAFT_1299972 [Collybia nuda]|uniref:F-box domain-containing protein n=1 Tax=Collybia nuda TaxID=64659 RepID=A0A9P5Y095_9AGAR|nr:hypothetical protein BDZ94DRAFT_1299972 [Collybia nuda]